MNHNFDVAGYSFMGIVLASAFFKKRMMNHNFDIAGYSGIDTATMFGAGGGFSAFTQPTGYGFDYHAGTGDHRMHVTSRPVQWDIFVTYYRELKNSFCHKRCFQHFLEIFSLSLWIVSGTIPVSSLTTS
jgi:hypothetical protein